MRMSKLFSRTLREAPSGADSKGYEYLLRAGFIRQLGAGVFNLLPLGFRAVTNIEAIIREEMERIGGQEILMPLVNPADVWKETGRYYSIDREMSRFKDRVGRDMVLAMTHEEVVTDLARGEIDSYKRMPLLVYQIQTKWRDDPRPRAGLIRVREFTMKDSYSFDVDQAGLDEQYKAHYTAYFRIFGRAGLPVIVVGADSGMMGGKISHEYMYLSPIGEDTIITCPACHYTANRQVASFKKVYQSEEMRPMEKVFTPETKTIDELVAFLKIEKRQTAKSVFMVGTFIDDTNGEEENKLIVGVVRGDLEVEENKLQNACRANALRPAHPEEIAEMGMVAGYGSAIGAKEGIVVIVDDSVAKSNNLVAGANEWEHHWLNTNFGRDYHGTVADIASAQAGFACPQCGKPLSASKGIEVGNIFQLGTRYSESMECYFQDESGNQKPVIMGSYGIGVGRLLASLAEEYCDDSGLALPITVAPMQVHLVSLVKESETVDALYDDLTKAGIDVLYDDRKESAGVKFADADLIGLPIRITVGNRSLKEGMVEVKLRSNLSETLSFPLATVVADTQALIKRLTDEVEAGIQEREWDGL
ncbi:MAG: proline--tRNA ligase [Spirochaetales bacterium]|jgi:prolyl-tRNA synthetase|nr:proline--tRNA ligase [Spirochaetota bacterium]NLV61511.1 proline--tRNA ligase [Spirochaetales bacterium]HOQ94698.1 proline--tRNA ligase [Sphaerochaeta sp.]